MWDYSQGVDKELSTEAVKQQIVKMSKIEFTLTVVSNSAHFIDKLIALNYYS